MIQLSGKALSKIDRQSAQYIALLEAHARLAKKDPTLWGENAAREAAIRLNWIYLPQTSRELLPALDAVAAKHRDKNVVILCGMGGSSLGPEVIALTYKKQLFILDSTDPNHVKRALKNDLAKTLVIVSSKSGSTIETSSARAIFEDAFKKNSLDPITHMLFVTDPGSPLDKQVREQGFSVVNVDPHVGGRFSVLSAFGLVPAALIGVDVSVLLDAADDAQKEFLLQPQIVCDIAYMLSYVADQYISLSDEKTRMPGLSDWIEQLIAESTGKNEVGRLPVVVKSFSELSNDKTFHISFQGEGDLVVEAELSAQFIIWEWVTALVGFALKVDPFNQPNVTEAKDATTSILSQWKAERSVQQADHIDSGVEIFGAGSDIKAALKELIESIPTGGYIAIMAYLDRFTDSNILDLRSILSEKSQRPTTFGWGPRFLHSTGQFHKGGQPNGVFLQITGASQEEIAIPGQEFGLQTLISAQALGDAKALASRGYPLLRFNLQIRAQGIDALLDAAKSL